MKIIRRPGDPRGGVYYCAPGHSVISFGVLQSGDPRLVIYNILGRTVRCLVDDYLPAGDCVKSRKMMLVK